MSKKKRTAQQVRNKLGKRPTEKVAPNRFPSWIFSIYYFAWYCYYYYFRLKDNNNKQQYKKNQLNCLPPCRTIERVGERKGDDSKASNIAPHIHT